MTTDSEAGLTLIELLVVIALMAVVSAMVVLRLPARDDALMPEAERLARGLRLAAQETILSGQPVGVAVANRGYRFFRLQDGNWRPADSARELAGRDLPPSITITLEQAGEKVETDLSAPPPIRFSPIGMASEFRLTLRDARGRDVRISGDLSGAITLEDGDA